MHYVMKEYGRIDVRIHVFLISTLAGVEWSASRLRQTVPGTHCIGGWVGPQQPAWTICRSENSWPYRHSNSDPSVVQAVVGHYTDSVTSAWDLAFSHRDLPKTLFRHIPSQSWVFASCCVYEINVRGFRLRNSISIVAKLDIILQNYWNRVA
jgi:hypothetical protein